MYKPNFRFSNILDNIRGAFSHYIYRLFSPKDRTVEDILEYIPGIFLTSTARIIWSAIH